MGDLKTPFSQPVYPDTSDLSGALATARGTDPLIDTTGVPGIKTPYSNAPLKDGDMDETANSVSGLPLQPQRFQPSQTAPEPPTLQDRNPGNVDKQ